MCSCLIPGALSVVLSVGSATKGETMEECNSCLVPHFEECSQGVNVNSEFIFEECHGTNFPILSFSGLRSRPVVCLFLLKHEATQYAQYKQA